MARKSYNQKLQDSKDMPKIAEITDPRAISMYGGTKLLIAPPLAYDEVMRKVPEGVDGQKLHLEAEGHTVVQRGKRYFVKDYRDSVFEL